MPTSPLEDLLYTTIHILAEGKDGVADGTGFFYRFRFEAGSLSVIVTNKHVVEDADRVTIVFHDAADDGSPKGTFSPYTIALDPDGIINHPDDDVDLCAIGFDIEQIMKETGRRIFNRFLTASTIPGPERWAAMDAFEEVTMIGCPNGLFDRANHMPIARRGIAASHPAIDFENRREFLVDMAVFPGSSGSPVFLIDRVGVWDKFTADLDLTQRRKLFIGILYAGPEIENAGVLVKKPKKVRVDTMMHLGYVIKSTEVHVLEAEAKRRIGQV